LYHGGHNIDLLSLNTLGDTILIANQEEETEIIRLAKAGSEAGWNRLYAKYYRTVYRLARRVLSDTTAAEDATQETFLAVLRSIDLFNGKSSFSTWVYRIAIHIAWRELKKRSPKIPGAPYEFNDSGGQVRALEIEVDIETALNSLKPEERIVIELMRIQGFDVQETSYITGLSSRQVKRRDEDGLKNLQKWMKA
jgi:RNA polymerase sigma factor (sigma-70 family)